MDDNLLKDFCNISDAVWVSLCNNSLSLSKSDSIILRYDLY